MPLGVSPRTCFWGHDQALRCLRGLSGGSCGRGRAPLGGRRQVAPRQNLASAGLKPGAPRGGSCTSLLPVSPSGTADPSRPRHGTTPVLLLPGPDVGVLSGGAPRDLWTPSVSSQPPAQAPWPGSPSWSHRSTRCGATVPATRSPAVRFAALGVQANAAHLSRCPLSVRRHVGSPERRPWGAGASASVGGPGGPTDTVGDRSFSAAHL